MDPVIDGIIALFTTVKLLPTYISFDALKLVYTDEALAATLSANTAYEAVFDVLECNANDEVVAFVAKLDVVAFNAYEALIADCAVCTYEAVFAVSAVCTYEAEYADIAIAGNDPVLYTARSDGCISTV